MTGHSLLSLAGGAAPGPGAARERVFIERERHANVRRGDLSYPARAIRTADHLYIRNYRPDRWPAGDPELYVAVGPFGDIDDGPTKQLLLSRRDDPPIKRYFDLAVAKRPAEELFDLKKDPGQLTNVAGDPAYAAVRDRLKKELDAWQRTTRIPGQRRMTIAGIAIRTTEPPQRSKKTEPLARTPSPVLCPPRAGCNEPVRRTCAWRPRQARCLRRTACARARSIGR